MQHELVEVFKTNIQEPGDAQHLRTELQRCFPACRIVFDLEDCDRVLKIAGKAVDPVQVQSVLENQGFWCQVLE